jgi:hypothetical protein
MKNNLQKEQKHFLLQAFKIHIKKVKNIQNWINIQFEARETQIQEKEPSIERKHYKNEIQQNQQEKTDEG